MPFSATIGTSYGTGGQFWHAITGTPRPIVVADQYYCVTGSLGPAILGGTTGPRGTVSPKWGHTVLGPLVSRGQLILGSRVRGDNSRGGHPVL